MSILILLPDIITIFLYIFKLTPFKSEWPMVIWFLSIWMGLIVFSFRFVGGPIDSDFLKDVVLTSLHSMALLNLFGYQFKRRRLFSPIYTLTFIAILYISSTLDEWPRYMLAAASFVILILALERERKLDTSSSLTD